MSRNYPLLRLTPDQAGQLQHAHNRLQASHAQLQAERAALEHALRAAYGSQAFLKLRNTARNAALAEQLKQEIAA